MSTVKLCVVGPKGCGKTTACKLLAESSPDTTYDPTAGVRVQELERELDGVPVSVQLWDCSGDFAAYEACFPAMRLGMDGLVLVHDADDEAAERTAELERWRDAFAGAEPRLRPEQCVLLGVARNAGGPVPTSGRRSASSLADIPAAEVGIGGDPRSAGEKLGEVLDGVLRRVVALKREREERSVMG